MIYLLAIASLSAVVGCLCGRFLAQSVAFLLAAIIAAIVPIAASVSAWPSQERTLRGIFTIGWFSYEAVGFLAIPWILCLAFAAAGVMTGRWLRRTSKRANVP